MVVSEVGYNYFHPVNFEINRPHGQHDCAAVVFTSPAFLWLDNNRQELAPDTVIIFTEGKPMHYGSMGEPFTNNWFHFKTDDFNFFKNLRIPLNTPLSGFPTRQLSDIILKLSHEKSLGEAYYPEISKHLVKVFFYTLARLIPTDKKAPIPSELIDVRNAIFGEPQKNWDISSLCAIAGYSRSYFQHKYKEAFGTTPQQDVIESKMTYARYLLENTQYRANEIAFLCGYTEESHFSHTFKRKTGLTPLNYRRRLMG